MENVKALQLRKVLKCIGKQKLVIANTKGLVTAFKDSHYSCCDAVKTVNYNILDKDTALGSI